jgi:hypothetical protein
VTSQELLVRLHELNKAPLAVPGRGQTAARHKRLMEIGREDLSLARLAEAHFDALAILEEADRIPDSNAIYGVWASEIKDQPLQIVGEGEGSCIVGTKMFCTGAGIIDRALITVGQPDPILVDVNLAAFPDKLDVDLSDWQVSAFQQTRTATVRFLKLQFEPEDVVGDPGWYLRRPGFWHGACGPASCWAGGALGLLDYAISQPRCDPHTLAHLGGIQASAWALRAYLAAAGDEIDADSLDYRRAHIRALTVRHLVEQECAAVLQRLGRAYGPYPLAMEKSVSERYQELQLYLRQCHAERDLESLGEEIRKSTVSDIGRPLYQKHEQSNCSCTHDDGTQPP